MLLRTPFAGASSNSSARLNSESSLRPLFELAPRIVDKLLELELELELNLRPTGLDAFEEVVVNFFGTLFLLDISNYSIEWLRQKVDTSRMG